MFCTLLLEMVLKVTLIPDNALYSFSHPSPLSRPEALVCRRQTLQSTTAAVPPPSGPSTLCAASTCGTAAAALLCPGRSTRALRRHTLKENYFIFSLENKNHLKKIYLKLVFIYEIKHAQIPVRLASVFSVLRAARTHMISLSRARVARKSYDYTAGTIR